MHPGVRVTLEDGSQHLIQKGKGYGESGTQHVLFIVIVVNVFVCLYLRT